MKWNAERNRTIEEQLMTMTEELSNFENQRAYIGMSSAYLPPDEILRQYQEGKIAGRKTKLLCYKGYQMEADLIKRYKALSDPSGYGTNNINSGSENLMEGYEITAFDNLVKGHPDIVHIDNNEIVKIVMLATVPSDNDLPNFPNQISIRKHYQMQAYLHFSGCENGLFVYESRDNGFIRVFDIEYMPYIGEEIYRNFKKVVDNLLPY